MKQPKAIRIVTQDDIVHDHLMNLDQNFNDIQKLIDKGLARFHKIVMTESAWRASFGSEARFAYKRLTQLDAVLNPDKYRKAKESQAKRDPNALLDIHGNEVTPK